MPKGCRRRFKKEISSLLKINKPKPIRDEERQVTVIKSCLKIFADRRTFSVTSFGCWMHLNHFFNCHVDTCKFYKRVREHLLETKKINKYDIILVPVNIQLCSYNEGLMRILCRKFRECSMCCDIFKHLLATDVSCECNMPEMIMGIQENVRKFIKQYPLEGHPNDLFDTDMLEKIYEEMNVFFPTPPPLQNKMKTTKHKCKHHSGLMSDHDVDTALANLWDHKRRQCAYITFEKLNRTFKMGALPQLSLEHIRESINVIQAISDDSEDDQESELNSNESDYDSDLDDLLYIRLPSFVFSSLMHNSSCISQTKFNGLVYDQYVASAKFRRTLNRTNETIHELRSIQKCGVIHKECYVVHSFRNCKCGQIDIFKTEIDYVMRKIKKEDEMLTSNALYIFQQVHDECRNLLDLNSIGNFAFINSCEVRHTPCGCSCNLSIPVPAITSKSNQENNAQKKNGDSRKKTVAEVLYEGIPSTSIKIRPCTTVGFECFYCKYVWGENAQFRDIIIPEFCIKDRNQTTCYLPNDNMIMIRQYCFSIEKLEIGPAIEDNEEDEEEGLKDFMNFMNSFSSDIAEDGSDLDDRSTPR